jgi:hypothetical protein
MGQQARALIPPKPLETRYFRFGLRRAFLSCGYVGTKQKAPEKRSHTSQSLAREVEQ